MKRILYIFGIVTLSLAGCYDDKGNYDYKEVNELILGFTPEATSEFRESNLYTYQYRQPPLDTLEVTYTPVIKQTGKEDESNLEFLWRVSYVKEGKRVIDSVYTKELLLKFPPRKTSDYSVQFKVTDVTTRTAYYRTLNMKTVIPFIKSWFVLNGPEGDRQLSVVEYPNHEDSVRITLDVNQELWGERRFQKAVHITYTGEQGQYIDHPETLTVIQPDSVNWLKTSTLMDGLPAKVLFPRDFSETFAYGVANNVGRYSLVVDQKGKFYHSGFNGFYFKGRAESNVEEYEVDKIYAAERGFVTVWDKTNRKLMYYQLGMNNCYWNTGTSYPTSDAGNDALLTVVDLKGSLKGEWSKNEILWLGQGITPRSLEDGALAIGKVTDSLKYNVYHIEAGKAEKGEEEGIVIRKIGLDSLDVDVNSCFASSVAYPDQFFYTKESRIFHYNLESQEAAELYDAGGIIAKMQFRVCSSHYGVTIENRCIGLVVNKPDGTGELHEVFLDEAGDVVKVLVHTGFGTIQDIVYSYILRNL